jgi:hypothetical protein
MFMLRNKATCFHTRMSKCAMTSLRLAFTTIYALLQGFFHAIVQTCTMSVLKLLGHGVCEMYRTFKYVTLATEL